MTVLMKKITLLLLGMPAAIMVTILSASMTQIYAAYPQYNESIVTMILTIPNLSVMVGLILAPILLKKVPIKTLIVAGLSISLVGSVLPAWCDNFLLILFLRAMCGVGCGLVLPLQFTFFASYPEQERAVLIGLSTTVSCMIAALVASISGVVAETGWKNVFYLYFIIVVAVIFAVLFLPKHIEKQDANESAEDENNNVAKKNRISDYGSVLFVYYFLLTGCYLFMSVLTAEIAPYLENTGLGGATESGLMMSVNLIGSLLSGIILSRYLKIFKGLAMPVIFLAHATGCLLLWLAPSLPTVGIAALIIGLFLALISCVVNYELSVLLPLELFTTASAGTNFFVFVLQFISPMLFIGLVDIVPNGSFRSVFLIYAIAQFIFLIVAYLLLKVITKTK